MFYIFKKKVRILQHDKNIKQEQKSKICAVAKVVLFETNMLQLIKQMHAFSLL